MDLGTHLRDKRGHLFLWDLELFLPSFKVGETKVEKRHIFRLSRNWVLEADLGTHLIDEHEQLFLSDLDLFWSSFQVGKTKVENMHFCQISLNWIFKVDLGTHSRDKFLKWNSVPIREIKHWNLFLWDLELFLPSFKVGETKVEIMHFCRLSQNRVSKVDIGTHFRNKHRHLFLWAL